MRGRGDGPAGAAGGPTRHVPVLLGEVSEALAIDRGGLFVDGTFGAGGYTNAILSANAQNGVIAVDRDPDAIAAGAAMVEASGGRLRLLHGRFSQLSTLLDAEGVGCVDGIVLDIGVSSMQLDEAGRGFSFRHDGPLDMRMERDGVSAADIVNEAPEAELADIFFHYGEERRARAVARAIIEARRRSKFTSTRQLADLVATLVRQEPGVHPATRVFQALRIAVNDELGELVHALQAAEESLNAGGRLVVVTFHSLEDRIVKQFFALRTGRAGGASRHLPAGSSIPPSFRAITRGAVIPGREEIASNPRSRSAKLRAGERTADPVHPPAEALTLLGTLPRTADRGRSRR
jgi:16S rRNA (cytosine1402-N4)-methyltransferase